MEQMGSKEKEFINDIYSHESWGWGRSDKVERRGIVEGLKQEKKELKERVSLEIHKSEGSKFLEEMRI